MSIQDVCGADINKHWPWSDILASHWTTAGDVPLSAVHVTSCSFNITKIELDFRRTDVLKWYNYSHVFLWLVISCVLYHSECRFFFSAVIENPYPGPSCDWELSISLAASLSLIYLLPLHIHPEHTVEEFTLVEMARVIKLPLNLTAVNGPQTIIKCLKYVTPSNSPSLSLLWLFLNCYDLYVMIMHILFAVD